MSTFRGIDRSGIETAVGEFIVLHTGIPEGRVFIPDNQANEAAPKRPWVSFIIKPDTSEKGPAEWRQEPGLEYWRVEVTDSSDATYTLTIDGVDYVHVAVSETTTQIRDALVTLAAGAANAEVTATGTTTDSIDIESDTTAAVGLRLGVATSPTSMTKTRLRAAAVTVSSEQVELIVDIQCAGLYKPESPGSEDNGEAIASNLESAFRNIQNTEAMRRLNYVPRRFRRINSDQLIDGEAVAIGGLDVILGANQCAVANQANTLSAPVEAV